MIDYCAAAPAGSGFVSATTAFIDCHTALLDVGAYQGLAAPGSTLSIVLTGLLTIFIALIGYNLLLGQGPTLQRHDHHRQDRDGLHARDQLARLSCPGR